MRTVRLARVAAEAEILRLERLAARTAMRAVYAAVAAVFLLAVLCGIHVVIAILLLPHFGALKSALILIAGDLVLAIGFGWLALVSRPGAAEREALAVREMARQQLVQTAATVAMVAPLARLLGNRSIVRIALAAMMAKVFMSPRRD